MNNLLKKRFGLMISHSFFLLVSLSLLVDCSNANDTEKNLKTKLNKDQIKEKNKVIAPDFTLSDLQGKEVSLSDLKGKVVLLNFWGTWCGPCRKEIPDFINLSKKYKREGLEIVGITLTSGSPEKIQEFADQWGINYQLLTDINGNETQTVTALYGQATGKRITGIPTTFIIDREGHIRQRYVGPRSEKVFLKDIRQYL